MVIGYIKIFLYGHQPFQNALNYLKQLTNCSGALTIKAITYNLHEDFDTNLFFSDLNIQGKQADFDLESNRIAI